MLLRREQSKADCSSLRATAQGATEPAARLMTAVASGLEASDSTVSEINVVPPTATQSHGCGGSRMPAVPTLPTSPSVQQKEPAAAATALANARTATKPAVIGGPCDTEGPGQAQKTGSEGHRGEQRVEGAAADRYPTSDAEVALLGAIYASESHRGPPTDAPSWLPPPPPPR